LFTPRGGHSAVYKYGGANREFNTHGTKFTPGGQLCPWDQSLPLGAKLRMGLWGRCYDHSIMCFLPIFGKKMTFFLKSNANFSKIGCIRNLKRLVDFSPNFWAKIFLKS
jgi:hypothetical protein